MVPPTSSAPSSATRPRIAIHDVLVNVAPIPDDVIAPVPTAAPARSPRTGRRSIALGCRPVERDLLGADPHIRHDASKLARAVAGSGAGGRGAMNAHDERHGDEPPGLVAPPPVARAPSPPRVPDSQLAFGGLIAFTFILLLAPQMMVPALAVLAFIRPALFAASVAAVSYLCNRMLTGRPLTVITRELWLGAALLAWASITIPAVLLAGGKRRRHRRRVREVAAGLLADRQRRQYAGAAPPLHDRAEPRGSAPRRSTAILNYRAGVFMEGAIAVKRDHRLRRAAHAEPERPGADAEPPGAPRDRAPPDAAAAAPAHAAPHDHRARGGRHHPHVLARGLSRDGRHHGGVALEVPPAARAGMGDRDPRARHRVPAAPAVRLYAAAGHHGQHAARIPPGRPRRAGRTPWRRSATCARTR